jgi:hypothetical protein
MIAVRPERDADLGPVKPAGEVFVTRRAGPTGFSHEVVKRSAST